jgi:hypothetical protein
VTQLGLSIHPIKPGTVADPPAAPAGAAGGTRNAAGRAPEPVEASVACLNFPLPDDPQDTDMPVIAALPIFLPLGHGQTFPHTTLVADATSYTETFPLFQAWKAGLEYCISHNDSRSVTEGGGLFLMAGLAVPAGDPVPFEGYTVVDRVPLSPTAIAPTVVLFDTMAFVGVIGHNLGGTRIQNGA